MRRLTRQTDYEEKRELIKSISVPLSEWKSWEDWTPCYAITCTHHTAKGSLGNLSVKECRLLKEAIANHQPKGI